MQLFGDEGKQGGLEAELTIEIGLGVSDEAIIQKDIEVPRDVLLGRAPACSKQTKTKSAKVLNQTAQEAFNKLAVLKVNEKLSFPHGDL